MPESMLSESSESELQTLLILLFLSISLSLTRNLTLNDLGRCCASPGSIQHLAILDLVVRFVIRNLLLLPTNDSMTFKISIAVKCNRKLQAT